MMRTSSGVSEDMGGRAAQLERGLRGDGLDIGDPTNAIRAEKFPLFAHDALGLEVREGRTRSDRGFFSTFWLMRYHRAVARIRHASLGPQSLVRICRIVVIVQK